MNLSKPVLLTLTCIAGFSAEAQADKFTYLSPAQVYGGGTGQIASQIRASQDCFGDKTNLITAGKTPALAKSVVVKDFIGITPATDPTGTAPDNIYDTADIAKCNLFQFAPAGVQLNLVVVQPFVSATAFASNSAAGFVALPTGTTPIPFAHYALSETVMDATDLRTMNIGSGLATPRVPAVASADSHNRNFGRVIQIPAAIEPVVVAFDSVYKKVFNPTTGTIRLFRFNIQAPAARLTSGGLKIDRTTLCGIFNGTITNWNDPAITAQNRILPTDPGVSLKDPTDPDPFDVPLQIVGRGEASATTQAWTRHLSAVCGTTTYADSTSALPVPLRGPLYNKAVANKSPAGEAVGKYTLAVGNDGVAKYVDFTAKPTALVPKLVQGRIGYVNAEFALPTSAIVKTNIFNLVTANLQNKALTFVVPSTTSALASYFGILPPTVGDRAKAELWVQPYSRTAAIADPSSSGAYPIVGNSNFLLHTCYRDANVRRALVAYLQFYYTSPTVNSTTAFNEGLVTRSGQAPMPLPWRQAITETFWATTPATQPLGLFIAKGTSTADLDITNPGAPAYTDTDGVNIAASKSCVTTPVGGAG